MLRAKNKLKFISYFFGVDFLSPNKFSIFILLKVLKDCARKRDVRPPLFSCETRGELSLAGLDAIPLPGQVVTGSMHARQEPVPKSN
jgi:hypothetical protein